MITPEGLIGRWRASLWRGDGRFLWRGGLVPAGRCAADPDRASLGCDGGVGKRAARDHGERASPRPRTVRADPEAIRGWERLEGPRLDRRLAGRTGDQLAATFVLLVEEEGRDGAHWLLSARRVLCDAFSRERIDGFVGGEGPDGGWRVREVWRVAPG
jgi:hypothetical protein